jgi:hypothetical protein
MYNNKFIEITSGLKEGNRVLLSPTVDTDKEDLGGAIIAEGEALPQSDTNQIARVMERTRELNGRNSPGGTRERGENGPSRTGQADGGSPRPNRDPAREELNPAAGSGQGSSERSGRRQRSDAENDSGSVSNRHELLKQFDKNRDGQLDDAERAAMREQFGRERRRQTPPPGGSSE